MLITRKIGKIVRGSATLPQILTASALGGMLGFVPGFFLPGDLGGGFMQAPGLILSIFALVLLVDANLAVFGIVTAGAKLLSFLLLPVSFAIGRFLLEGPTEGLFRVVVNAPVLAFFGFERYATTGGVALGLVVGLVAGFVLWKALHALRVKMASVEEGSERYQKLSSKKSVKLLTWVFLGKGKGKKTWREISESDRKTKGVRLAGVGAVVVLGVGVWFLQGWLASGWLEQQARVGLTAWNGATVDLDGLQIDLGEGRVAFSGLAMADADQLDQDVFRARTLELDVATGELLAGRFVVERLASGEAKSGVVRQTPGKRLEPVEPPPPPPPGPGKTIEDYLKDAEVWKGRLDKAAEWIEKFSGGGETPAEETPEQRDERVAQQREALGIVDVVATHLIAKVPAVTIRDLAFEGMTFGALEGDAVDVTGTNLSSHPALAEGAAALSAKARSGLFGLELRYDPAQPARTGLTFGLNGLSVDSLASSLKDSPIHGGTLDVRLDGALDLSREGGPWIDLPLVVTLRGTRMSVGGKEASLDGVELPLGLSGSLRNPKVIVDGEKIADALVAAGRQELANEVRARAEQLLGGKIPGVGDALGGLVDGSKTPEQLAEEAKKKAEEEAAKKAQEELTKKLPGGIGDIFKKKQN